MNLFLVTSPFQYICALEAKAHYQTKENILVLVNQDKEPGYSQQMKLLDEGEWDYIIHTYRKHRSKTIPLSIKKIKSLTNKNKLINFFHAEYNGWQSKLFLKNLDIVKEVYFDDGTATITEYEEFIRNKNIYNKSKFLSNINLRIRNCKPATNMHQSSNFEIFTVFNLISPAHKVIKNSFNQLLKHYGKPNLYSKNAPIGFIGQGSIGHKYQKSIDEYLTEVKFFLEKSNYDLIYFPHRQEDDSVTKQVKSLKGLKYHSSELPLEIELIDKKIVLSEIVGPLSTVLFTSGIISPELRRVVITRDNMTSLGYSKKMLNKVTLITKLLKIDGAKEVNF